MGAEVEGWYMGTWAVGEETQEHTKGRKTGKDDQRNKFKRAVTRGARQYATRNLDRGCGAVAERDIIRDKGPKTTVSEEEKSGGVGGGEQEIKNHVSRKTKRGKRLRESCLRERSYLGRRQCTATESTKKRWGTK